MLLQALEPFLDQALQAIHSQLLGQLVTKAQAAIQVCEHPRRRSLLPGSEDIAKPVPHLKTDNVVTRALTSYRSKNIWSLNSSILALEVLEAPSSEHPLMRMLRRRPAEFPPLGAVQLR